MDRITPVILSGGSGTRLWPVSRPEMPKQLLAIAGTETMLQATARRTMETDLFDPPIIVANARHADPILHQLEAIGVTPRSILLEPAARNTAPAIALAALAAESRETILLIMPSDHVIADIPAFHAAIRRARPAVADGWMVTFGIEPDAPETGYGWIKIGAEIVGDVNRVERFIEKPPREVAEQMLAAGGHAWNGGIFMFKAGTYLDSLRTHAPKIAAAAEQAMALVRNDGIYAHPDAAAFSACPSDSIDYSVMEKSDQVAIVPVAMGWSDVGSWDALHAISDRDGEGNVCRGTVIAIDSHDCLIRAEGKRIALVGVSDLIVVADGDDILILPRGRSQEVKRVIERLDG